MVTIEHLVTIFVILLVYYFGTFIFHKKEVETSYKLEEPVTLKHVDQKFTSAHGAALPKILSDADQKRYKDIFSLQEAGKWTEADPLIAGLENPVLLGDVLAQRYLHKSYKPTQEQLVAWINEYSDLAQAPKIYKLASAFDSSLKKKRSRLEYLYGLGDDSPLTSHDGEAFSKDKYWDDRSQSYKAWTDIHRMIKRGRLVSAIKMLQSNKAKRWLTPLERDAAQWDIAQAFFTHGKDNAAFRLIRGPTTRSGPQLPKIYWTAGLIAWRLQYYKEAAYFFSKVSEASDLSTWERAAGSFWAFRALREMKSYENARQMLERAAKYPRTFYGVLAVHALGDKQDYGWKSEKLGAEQVKDLAGIPAIKRALAFHEIHQNMEAEKELRTFYPAAPLRMKKQLIALARELDFPSLQVVMARKIADSRSTRLDYALYPVPPWKPLTGFRIEPALLYAIMKKESGFNPLIKSPKGALGLMQIKPATANYVMKKFDMDLENLNLYDPVINLTLGQYYVEYLLRHNSVKGNLIFLLAAYNAGPSRLSDWVDSRDFANDPLFFIEILPSEQTRNYVNQVLTNFWLYLNRMGQTHTSKEDLLQGRWTFY
jgi:soluble lytic murein transglycosylase-like protein